MNPREAFLKKRVLLVERLIAATESGRIKWQRGFDEFQTHVGSQYVGVDVNGVYLRDRDGTPIDVIKGHELPGERPEHPYRSSPSPLDRLYAVVRAQAMDAAGVIRELLKLLPEAPNETMPEDD